jgi:hypothetical protein
VEHAVSYPTHDHVARLPRRRMPLLRLVKPATPHSAAATRFAETCAAIGGTTMLHDLMPDVVTISFGSKTDAICKRLHMRGWDFVGTGDWQGERVLGVSFAGDRRANRTADDLAEALITVVGELEMAETRTW